jgi:hypothetical protein
MELDEFGYICYKKFIFLMKLFKKYANINCTKQGMLRRSKFWPTTRSLLHSIFNLINIILTYQ